MIESITQKRYEELYFSRSAPDTIIPAETGPNDPGLIIYTSGTTEEPKGAVLTQKSLAHDAMNIVDRWEITDSDVLCHALRTSLIAGAHIIMLDQFLPPKGYGYLIV